MHLVARKRQQIHVRQLADEIQRPLARRLRRIRVEHDARIGFLRDPRPVAHRPDHARFVVRVHQRHEQRVRPQCPHVVGHGDLALPVHRQDRHLVAAPLQLAADFQHRRMLHRARHDVLALRIRRRHAENRRVVAFRRAGGEQDFGGFHAAQKRRDGLARGLERAGHLQRGLVHGARIEEFRPEIGLHRRDHFRRHRGRRVVVGENQRGIAHGGLPIRRGSPGSARPPGP